jgi:hypothetical protein
MLVFDMHKNDAAPLNSFFLFDGPDPHSVRLRLLPNDAASALQHLLEEHENLTSMRLYKMLIFCT